MDESLQINEQAQQWADAMETRCRELAVENVRLTTALQEIEMNCSGALNNGFPEDAPDTVEFVRNLAAAALSGANIKVRDAQPTEAQGGAFRTQPPKDKS